MNAEPGIEQGRAGIAMPKRAMVLAAGLGTRLRPITQTVPKPMVRIAGVPMIDSVLDRLAASGVEDAVVNTHHLAEMLRAHLAGRTRPRLQFSHEETILETGGGIKKALPLLGDDPFFAVNAKIVWLNGKIDALARLAEAWDDAKMDALLLLQPTVTAVGYDGPGDFFVDQDGHVRRRRDWEVAPFLFSGIQLLHPRIFADSPDGAFSMNVLYDRMIEAERLYALRHDGEWFHVSTPRHLDEVEAYLAQTGLKLAEQ
jgi:MurNAc alpha-1-phosphate uridylyltransferase